MESGCPTYVRFGHDDRIIAIQASSAAWAGRNRQPRWTYGAPRIHRDLPAASVRAGRKRVARLLKQAGLRGVSRRK